MAEQSVALKVVQKVHWMAVQWVVEKADQKADHWVGRLARHSVGEMAGQSVVRMAGHWALRWVDWMDDYWVLRMEQCWVDLKDQQTGSRLAAQMAHQ